MCGVSVVMPVYNVEKYLAAAVDSILSQTFSDFMLIAVRLLNRQQPCHPPLLPG